MAKTSGELMQLIAEQLADQDQQFKQLGPADKLPKAVREQRAEQAFAASTPDLVVLTGYLSAASEDGWRRLYLDWAFRSWLLLNEDDILHDEPFEDADSPISHSTAVWLKADAKVGQGSARTNNPLQDYESRYLTGDFISADDAAQSGSPGLFTDVTSASCCAGHHLATNTRFMVCPSGRG